MTGNSVDITVENEVFMSAGLLFGYYPVPTVISFHPTQIAAHGSSVVTVVGRGFGPGSSSGPFCRFGSRLVVPGRLVSRDSIECVFDSEGIYGNVSVSLSPDGIVFSFPFPGSLVVTKSSSLTRLLVSPSLVLRSTSIWSPNCLSMRCTSAVISASTPEHAKKSMHDSMTENEPTLTETCDK